MSLNQDKIIENYSRGIEDGRAARDRSTGLEFHYTKKHLDGYIKPNDRVLEIGCATGYYGFYYAGKCSEYRGVDIVPLHIEIFQKKIRESGLENISCAVGDATNLAGIADGSYDVVLCLGPMYHLSFDEREKCFAECYRVCREGGIAAFSYINLIGVYAGACIFDSATYPNSKANEAVFEHGTDDLRPGMFYYTTPEEINDRAAKHGFRKLLNLGTDFFVMTDVVNRMDDERFETMRPLYDQMTSHESCTGMSNHALLICRKEHGES